jgi:hypothetical protein
MLSQLSAIRYLYREGLLEHEAVMSMTLAELKIAHSKVTPRGLEWKTTSALEALRSMDERGHDSLPLTENGDFVSTLEWTDFEPLFICRDYRQYQSMTCHDLKLRAWQHEDVAVMAKTASVMAANAKQVDTTVKQRYPLRPVVPPARRSLERTSSSAGSSPLQLGQAASSHNLLGPSTSTASLGVVNVTSKKGHTREASFSSKPSEEELVCIYLTPAYNIGLVVDVGDLFVVIACSITDSVTTIITNRFIQSIILIFATCTWRNITTTINQSQCTSITSTIHSNNSNRRAIIITKWITKHFPTFTSSSFTIIIIIIIHHTEISDGIITTTISSPSTCSYGITTSKWY